MQSDTHSCHSIRNRMLMVMSVLLVAACGVETPSEETQGAAPEQSAAPTTISTRPQGLGSTNKVLILAGTVSGGLSSVEARAATNLGYTVEVATDAAWAAKSSANFATYRAIIMGDPNCSTNRTLLQAAVNSRNVWGPVVDGNVIIVGTDPVLHGVSAVTNNAVKFAAAQEGKTGAYINLSCYYHATASRTPVPVLEPFGTFTVTGVGCYDDAHIVATHSALSGLSDGILSNWSCSVHEAFDTYPAANFTPLVIARDPAYGSRLPGSKDFADGSHGVPYILARGAVPVRCGDGVIQYPEECDTGASNGVPGTTCSSVCRLHWCGDGVLDSGEECDTGASNGSGTCSASCKSVVINRPPVAQCKDLSLSADATCGASGSVNNGSYDPDGDLVGCTQSQSTFGVGSTSVTLTCTDKTGLKSSCSATVTVADTTPPSISCPDSIVAECVDRRATVGVPISTIGDNCGGAVVGGPNGTITFPVGTTPVTHVAQDYANNSSSCTFSVTVADTLAPVVSLVGYSTVTQTCRTPYVETGVNASDACYGDLSAAVTVSGSVNTNVPGTYTLTYSAKDAAGNVGSATRTVVVVPGADGTCEDRGGGWILTGSMALPRLLHTATLLDDGRVLVAGGFNVTSELYNPETKTWSATGNNLGTHRGHTATKLQDGRVLIAGGGVCPLTSATAELYIPSLGKWKPAGVLNTQRYYHAAVLLPDGKVLVTGGATSEYDGSVLASSELYDPATGKWTYTGSLNTARRNHTITLLPNGKVLVTGGSDASEYLLHASAEIYDPATGTWTAVASMGTGRSYHTATLLPNGKVLVAGGSDIDPERSASAELYDPATNTWAATGSMLSPRRFHTANLLPDGRVLVAGGYHQLTGIQTASDLYDPATGTWSKTAVMNVDRYKHTATPLPNGTVLAVGGVSNHDQASAEYYDLDEL